MRKKRHRIKIKPPHNKSIPHFKSAKASDNSNFLDITFDLSDVDSDNNIIIDSDTSGDTGFFAKSVTNIQINDHETGEFLNSYPEANLLVENRSDGSIAYTLVDDQGSPIRISANGSGISINLSYNSYNRNNKVLSFELSSTDINNGNIDSDLAINSLNYIIDENLFSNLDFQTLGTEQDDTLFGGSGNDTLLGLAGNDTLYGGNGNDLVIGDEGNDVLHGGSGNDRLYGKADNDRIYGNDGNDLIDGGDGHDHLVGQAGDDTLIGGAGNDGLYGYTGNDTLHGGSGNDVVIGDEGNDVLHGGSGNDRLYGKADNDRIYGNDGNDLVDGGDGHDHLVGQAGNDTLYGQAGNDGLYGYTGNDLIDGGSGNDVVIGDEGDDTLVGGSGNDVLVGKAGNDTLIGGTGSDTFRLSHDLEIDAIFDTIEDFNRAEGDKFQVTGSLDDYTISFGNVSGDSADDTIIKYQGNQMAVVEDTVTVDLNTDFILR